MASKVPNAWLNIIGPTGLSVSISEKKNGRLTQQKCGKSKNVLWKIEQTDNVFMLINENGAVFDNNQGKGNNGNPELSGERTNKDNQKWDLVKMKNGKIHIKDKINNKCFDDTGRKEINRLYHLWDCNDSNRNQWFEFVEPEIIIKKVNYPKGWLHIVGPTGLCVSLINDNKAERLQLMVALSSAKMRDTRASPAHR